MCLSTAVCLAVPMFSESQYVNYVKAGRAFERKLVGAGRDFDMPSDSGAMVVWHRPQVVADVG